MRVYVESNFVLELAFAQEQSEPCEELLSMCESNVVELALPIYSLAEPHETLVRKVKRRSRLQSKISAEVGQLRRTESYSDAADQLEEAAALFATSAEEERLRLELIVKRLSHCAHLIPLTTQILDDAYSLQHEFDLTPQDSFVLASVILDLDGQSGEPACFVTRNSKDFDDPDIVQTLKHRQCELLIDFWKGLRFVRESS